MSLKKIGFVDRDAILRDVLVLARTFCDGSGR
jgi:hypothetical protein